MKIVQISDTHFSPSKPHFNGNWEPIRRWIEEVTAKGVDGAGLVDTAKEMIAKNTGSSM